MQSAYCERRHCMWAPCQATQSYTHTHICAAVVRPVGARDNLGRYVKERTSRTAAWESARHIATCKPLTSIHDAGAHPLQSLHVARALLQKGTDLRKCIK